MPIHTETVCLVVGPVPFIDVAVHVDKPPLAMRFVFLPVADVLGSIAPFLRAVAIAEASLPLTSVLGARGKCVRGALFALGVRVVNASVGNGFSCLVEGKVFGAALLPSSEQPDQLSGSVCAPPSLDFDDVVDV